MKILRKAQEKAEEAGVTLDVGELPTYTEGELQADDDPQRPVRLASHAVARIADRIGITRRVSRHLEGTEARAGIGSDLIALAVELGTRNADALLTILQDRMRQAQLRAAERQATGDHRPSRFRRSAES